MAKDKSRFGTVYNQLNKVLNLDGTANIVDNKKKTVIIRGDSKEEIKRKNLELQQQEQLTKKFFKSTDHGFQKAMQYEAARLPAFLDYEGMEYYPIIASALDLFSEEATTIGENGNMLNVYSDKERIKNHLEELFYDILNINVTLPHWTRNVCKYGDNFVLLYTEKKKGVVTAKQMVTYEMERIERTVNGKIDVRFKNRETGDDFTLFEIAHFRLLQDDKYLPYGSSILNKIRRVFRQLIMAEDAMLTYRIVRAGEKRIFKIDVGNIDEDDVENYVQRIASRFKKQQQVYPEDGQIDYRFNILGNDEDYIIPVRNSNVQTGIDTLPGASNLDQIQDIEYLRDNLFTGIGVPKPFLSFQDSAGDGKNMAQMDIRFSKKINRIQQAMLQELYKIAVIHLYLLGFSKEDLHNFKLSLTNPSIQQEVLMTELLQSKAQVYTELTRTEGGVAAMSHTEAKRRVFNMSDKDIIDDLKKQYMERVISQELQDAPLMIKKSSVFNDLNQKYGTGEEPPIEGGPEREDGEGEPEANQPPAGGGDTDTAPQSPGELPPVLGQGLGFNDIKSKMDKLDEYFNHLVNIGQEAKQVKRDNNKKLIKENEDNNQKLLTKINEMTKEIDGIIKKTGGSTNMKSSYSHKNFETSKFDNFDIMNIDVESELKRKSEKKKEN